MRKYPVLMLLAVCGAALAGAADAWVDRIAGISSDTYVDFPVRAGAAVTVAVSNDCAVAPLSFNYKAPENAEGTVLLGFRRYRGRCALFLDGKPVDDFPDDRLGPIHLLISAESLPEDRGDAYVQSLAPFAFADAFMVAEGDKTGLQNWEKLAGDWTLHAVTGRMVRAEDKGRLSRFPTQKKSASANYRETATSARRNASNFSNKPTSSSPTHPSRSSASMLHS